MTTITLIGKAGCHLCDVAREIVDGVIGELPDDIADRIQVREASIAEDPALYELWWEKIPVVMIDDEVHAHWRVSGTRLRDALVAASDQRSGVRS